MVRLINNTRMRGGQEKIMLYRGEQAHVEKGEKEKKKNINVRGDEKEEKTE